MYIGLCKKSQRVLEGSFSLICGDIFQLCVVKVLCLFNHDSRKEITMPYLVGNVG